MQLTKKQHEATQLLIQHWVSFLIYGGAIRGAKTFWIAIIFAELAILYPNSRWAIMRADRPKIINNLLPSVNEVYSSPHFASEIKSFNKLSLAYTFKNGSQVQLFPESFQTDKELSRFHGLEVNGFGLDELSEFQEQTLDKCFERAGSWLNAKTNIHGKKPRPLVLATCNPTKNWVKDRIYDPYVNGTLPQGWEYVPAKVTDNPYVPKSYLTNLKRNMTPLNYQRFVDGDWEYVERTGHEWLYQFSYTQHVQRAPYLPNVPTFLTFDFNVWPYMTLLCFQVVFDRERQVHQVRFYREYCLEHPKNTAKAVCQAWIRDYPKVYGATPVKYCGDKSGENRIPGFGEEKAFNPVRETLAPYLSSDSNQVFTGQFFNSFVRDFYNDILSGALPIELVFDEQLCPKTIKDIQEAISDPLGGFIKEKAVAVIGGLKVTYEKNGHCVDASKYGLLSAFSQLYKEKYHRRNQLA